MDPKPGSQPRRAVAGERPLEDLLAELETVAEHRPSIRSHVRTLAIVMAVVGVALFGIYLVAGPLSSIDFTKLVRSQNLRIWMTEFIVGFAAFLGGYALRDVISRVWRQATARKTSNARPAPAAMTASGSATPALSASTRPGAAGGGKSGSTSVAARKSDPGDPREGRTP